MLTIHDQQIGWVELLMYLMGIIAVAPAMAWNWNPMFLLEQRMHNGHRNTAEEWLVQMRQQQTNA